VNPSITWVKHMFYLNNEHKEMMLALSNGTLERQDDYKTVHEIKEEILLRFQDCYEVYYNPEYKRGAMHCDELITDLLDMGLVKPGYNSHQIVFTELGKSWFKSQRSCYLKLWLRKLTMNFPFSKILMLAFNKV
jgi:hypothetical protein